MFGIDVTVNNIRYLVHVGAGVLVELVAGREDDEGNLAVAEHRPKNHRDLINN
jgi:hypothetical protein